jgi:hypothetical protein
MGSGAVMGELGLEPWSGPLVSPNPSRPPFPLGFLQPPPSPPLSLGRHPPPIFFLLKPLQPSPPKTLATPPFLFPPPRCSPPAWFSVVWLRSQLEFGGRKKEGGREEPKVNLCLTFVVFVLQSIGLCIYLCESVEVLSRNFVSGWTTVVLGIWEFSWVN